MRSFILAVLACFIITSFGCIPQETKISTVQDPDNPDERINVDAMIRENKQLRSKLKQEKAYHQMIRNRLTEVKTNYETYQKKYYDADDLLRQADKRNVKLGEYIRDLEKENAKLKNQLVELQKKLKNQPKSNSNSKKQRYQ